MQWLAEDRSYPGAGLSLARMTVRPGQTSPAHQHPNCNEVIHVLTGQISERLAGRWVEAGPGDTVFVPAGTAHQTRCVGSDEAVMMIAYSAGTRIYKEA